MVENIYQADVFENEQSQYNPYYKNEILGIAKFKNAEDAEQFVNFFKNKKFQGQQLEVEYI